MPVRQQRCLPQQLRCPWMACGCLIEPTVFRQTNQARDNGLSMLFLHNRVLSHRHQHRDGAPLLAVFNKPPVAFVFYCLVCFGVSICYGTLDNMPIPLNAHAVTFFFLLCSWTSDSCLVTSRLRSALPLYHFNPFFCILHEVQPCRFTKRRGNSSLIIYKWSHCTIRKLSASLRHSELSQCTNNHMIVACLTHFGDNSRYEVLITRSLRRLMVGEKTYRQRTIRIQ